MAEKSKQVYDESKIKTLSSLDHIRLRTGMYIGRIGSGAHPDDGCYVLLKEVVDNAIDEYIMGHGKEVQITLDGSRVTVRDFGRGIPLGKVVDCVSKINTGAKYNDEVFQFSVGLNGVGTKAVNALSKNFLVRSHRDGEFAEAQFKVGKLKKEETGKTTEPNGTLIEFEPDPEIFKASEYQLEHIERRLRHYSYLNTGLKLIFTTPGAEPKTFQSRHGLMDLVMEELATDGSEPIYAPLHYAGKTLEFCFTHSNSRYGETFFSFVNGQFTSDGGTHLSAFREGLLKAVNEYGGTKYEGDDVRECMVGAVAIRLQDPLFESQTKNKLGNTEIRTELVNNVREELLHFFQRNKPIADLIMAKVKDTQDLRKELQNVKKLARERAKAITFRIPQLKDCKSHFDKKKEGKGRGTMVFICEGQSAAGSITSCRDVNNQAVFVLKGKPLNVWDLKRDVMYKNDEMYNLMQALNVEDTTDSLRYEKVILATDADVDGMHIRNLMITYFFKFFEQLIHDGHVYVLETPLFRVRNKAETIYCYSETERDNAVKKLGGKPEITRFKGLGEISPKEFAQFIGKQMRLSKIEFAPRAESGPIFDFYMGKNTPERKDYIMEKLVVPVEE